MICSICGKEEFQTFPTNNDYQYCTYCNMVVRKEFPTEIGYSNYNNLTEEFFKSMLQSDLIHYKQMFDSFKENKLFNITLQKRMFNTIYAFGGGFPKLESYLKSDDIIIYDVCKDNYLNNLELFRTEFDCKRDIEYRDFLLNIEDDEFLNTLNSIDKDSHDLITFVHFLEHLKPDLFAKTIKDLSKFKNNSNHKTFLIYQPCVRMDRDGRWFHWNKEHSTFLPLETYVRFLRENDFDVHFVRPYSDDLFIVFE